MFFPYVISVKRPDFFKTEILKLHNINVHLHVIIYGVFMSVLYGIYSFDYPDLMFKAQ